MLPQELDLIEKWLVTCGLRGLDPIEDWEIHEHLEALSNQKALEEQRDQEFLAALDAIKLGITDDMFDNYRDHLERRELEARVAAERHSEETNRTLNNLRKKHKFEFYDGISPHQVYWKFHTEDKLVHARIVTPTWGKYRVWLEWKDGKEKKKHCATYNRYNVPMPKWFPDHWKSDRSMDVHKFAYFYTQNIINNKLPL